MGSVELTPDTISVGPDGDPIRAMSVLEIWGTEAGLLANNQVIYCYITGKPAITGTEANAEMRMPACRVVALSGRNYTHGTNYTMTLRKNGSDTAITSGSVTSIANHFRITTGAPITFADGDMMALKIGLETGGPGSGFRGLFLEVEIDT